MSQLTEYCAAALYMTRLKLNTKCSNKWNCYTCNYCYFFSVFWLPALFLTDHSRSSRVT